jgi:asparagine synthase (glutamine-hydrolysing)
MCGIAGIFSINTPIPAIDFELQSMTDQLTHRGPDTKGIWINDSSTLGLGHRRLSILDLTESGNQPMLSHNGRYVIAFNGEIYNHLDIRKRIPGFTWRGTSDTETLLASIELWGLEKTLSLVAGMFAFALWDKFEEKLFLVRDRMGEKPLYYAFLNNKEYPCLIFSSELKSLKKYSSYQASIDRSSVGLFLEYSYIPSPYTIYLDTFKLEAGSLVVFDKNSGLYSKPVRYWKSEEVYASSITSVLGSKPYNYYLDDLDNLLQLVIGEQMLSDVQLGAFLSGGIDSSTIVAIMQKKSLSQVKTFTIGYNESGYSEHQHARAVANYLGTDHTELIVTDTMARNVIMDLPKVYDEPFADPSQIPTILVSQLASKHVKVSLSGDGGDEMFGGYNRYGFVKKYWSTLALLPPPLLRILSYGMRSLPEPVWDRIAGFLPHTSIGFKIHKAARVIESKTINELYQKLISSWSQGHSLVRGASQRITVVKELASRLELAPIDQMMVMDIITYLPDDILVKVDRAAMSCSLETRAPFLDHRVARFAWSIPLEYKLNGNNTKWILRELLYRYVPKAIVERPKMGFGFPIDIWLREGLRDWAESLLSYQRLEQESIFDPEPIRKIWQQHLSGKYNWAIQLWPILMFQAWLDQERNK